MNSKLDKMLDTGFFLLSEETRAEFKQLRERETEVVRILEEVPNISEPSSLENIVDIIKRPDVDPDGTLKEERLRIKKRLVGIQEQAMDAYEKEHGPVTR